MKLAIIGANGRTGQLLVQAALAAGHEVRAGVRRHNPFQSQHGLSVVTANATNGDDVLQLITGQDAVISVIGHVRGSPPTVQTDAMKTIVAAMHTAGITRVVSLTGTGARLPGDYVTIMDYCMNFAVSLVDPARVADGRQHLALLQASSLNWTVIRVLKLTDGTVQPYSLQPHGPARTFISRATVAQAIVEVVSEHRFIQAAPIISPSV